MCISAHTFSPDPSLHIQHALVFFYYCQHAKQKTKFHFPASHLVIRKNQIHYNQSQENGPICSCAAAPMKEGSFFRCCCGRPSLTMLMWRLQPAKTKPLRASRASSRWAWDVDIVTWPIHRERLVFLSQITSVLNTLPCLPNKSRS